MFKFSAVLLSVLVLSSCQSFNSQGPDMSAKREIANTGFLKGFIDDIARQTQGTANRMTSAQIEKKVLAYIKRKERDMAYGNWSKMGIMDDQAKNINGLYDDLPYMNKVHKWVSQNITSIIKVESRVAANAYKVIVNQTGKKFNPYKLTKKELNALTVAKRSSSSPFESSHVREVFIKGEIRAVKNSKIRKIYQDNYKLYSQRVKSDPTIAANIDEILESATTVTKRTGHSGMGKGCKTFNSKASVEVLEMKANLDIYRAKLIEEKAFRKAGGPFDKLDDISTSKRLTTQEIDEATEEAFEKVLNYTREEAKLAVRRLKRAPCQVY